MHHHQATADTVRRLDNLIRFGVIIEADYQKPAFRVRDGDLVTGWLPMLTWRNAATFAEFPLEIDEPVCFLLGKDGQGIILGGVATNPQEKGVLTLKAEKIRLIGPVEQTGGDMTSDGISAQHHKHGGIKPGPAKTDEPS